jgi:uncharacterized SAM-binding protein YcdF (DUF218 family)
MKMKLIWVLAVLLLIDSIWRILYTSINFGSFLLCVLTALAWGYALFHKQIDPFFATQIGRVVGIVLACGAAVFVGLMLLIHVLGMTAAATGQEDVLLVLGAGLRGETVTGLLAHRLNAAIEFYEQNPDVTIVVTGGQGRNETIPEAQAMKAYLVERGIPAQQILEESESTSTEENFLFSRALLEQHGFAADTPIAYTTNVFHCYRAGQYARAAGFTQAHAVPANIGLNSVLPCYMREVFAVLYYWVFRSPSVSG